MIGNQGCQPSEFPCQYRDLTSDASRRSGWPMLGEAGKCIAKAERKAVGNALYGRGRTRWQRW